MSAQQEARRRLIAARLRLWLARAEVYRAIREVENRVYPKPSMTIGKQAE